MAQYYLSVYFYFWQLSLFCCCFFAHRAAVFVASGGCCYSVVVFGIQEMSRLRSTNRGSTWFTRRLKPWPFTTVKGWTSSIFISMMRSPTGLAPVRLFTFFKRCSDRNKPRASLCGGFGVSSFFSVVVCPNTVSVSGVYLHWPLCGGSYGRGEQKGALDLLNSTHLQHSALAIVR